MTASSAQQPNPLEALSSAARGAAEAVATALARLPLLPTFALPFRTTPRRQQAQPPRPSSFAPPSSAAAAAAALSPSPLPSFPGARRSQQQQRVSKEELGRATWTLLHSVAAALPAAGPLPRRQRRAFCSLVHSLAELYPCAECAEHFAAIVDARPPERAAAGGGEALRRWACEAHNDVNEAAGKPRFDCSLVGARWAGLDCDGDGEDGGARGCALAGPGAAPRRR